jgi:NADPH:quinone reductase-like Zn-dependent oxidoreductase
MRAMVYDAFGPPAVLHLQDIEPPKAKGNEVLIKVRAASLNSWDWDLVRGKPFIVRLAGGGIKKPNFRVLGADLAGIVETIGNDVKQFKPGDEVFGDLSAANWGAFAEFACAPENSLTLKPPNVTFEEAAALPQAGVMAWQGIHDYMKLAKGQEVLINGAAGGVGTYAIQFAKMIGAQVTAVDRGDKLHALTALGADHVIDYRETDFTRIGKRFDLILDVVAQRNIWDYKKALQPKGMYLMIGGKTSTILQSMLFGHLASLTGNGKIRILVHQANKNLALLSTLLQDKKIKSVIHRSYALPELPEALDCLGNGNAIGKVVIRVTD